MKTLIHVHIFIRLCATACIVFGLYHLISAWPEVARLRKLIEKQKETMESLGGSFDAGGMIPSFAEIFLGPILLLVAGLVVFVGTKQVVRFIVGREQVESLLRSDKSGARPQSR